LWFNAPAILPAIVSVMHCHTNIKKKKKKKERKKRKKKETKLITMHGVSSVKMITCSYAF